MLSDISWPFSFRWQNAPNFASAQGAYGYWQIDNRRLKTADRALTDQSDSMTCCVVRIGSSIVGHRWPMLDAPRNTQHDLAFAFFTRMPLPHGRGSVTPAALPCSNLVGRITIPRGNAAGAMVLVETAEPKSGNGLVFPICHPTETAVSGTDGRIGGWRCDSHVSGSNR